MLPLFEGYPAPIMHEVLILQLATQKLKRFFTNRLSVAFLGAEDVETSKLTSPAQCSKVFEALLKELDAAGCISLHLCFIGPNLPAGKALGAAMTFQKGNVNVTLDFDRSLFHESKFVHDRSFDLVLACNAGIWGYDSWIPTLDLLFFGKLKGTNFVVTSYTLEESEDDYDTMKDYFDKKVVECGKNVKLEWKWDCEKNPHSATARFARTTKSTKTDSRGEPLELPPYFENNYWQCLKSVVTHSEILCRRCHESFNPIKNHGKACVYHPESWCGETAQRWMAPGETKGGAEVHNFYSCCGNIDMASKGCCATRHEGYDEPESEEKWGRRPGMGR